VTSYRLGTTAARDAAARDAAARDAMSVTLTGRGWALGATTVVLVLAGVLFGIGELFAIAAAALIVLLCGAGWVWRRPWDLRSARQVTPTRVAAGDDAHVELGFRNRARHRSPVVAVRDPFDGGRHWAAFLVAPLAGGETVRAWYQVPTTRRGVFEVGPLRLEITDPFGLVSGTRRGAAASPFTVHPRVVPLLPPRLTKGTDQHADGLSVISHHGSDFYAVRDYRTGDDLRRVHWPSTARHDELMIRQEETSSQGRLTVAVDLRCSAWDEEGDEGLETALSAAASVSNAALAEGFLVRLITTAGTDTRFGASDSQRTLVLDALAHAGMSPAGRRTAELGRRVGASPGEAVVVVTSNSEAGRALVAGLVHLPRPTLTVIMIGAGRGRRPDIGPHPVRDTRIVIVDGGIDGLAEAWQRSQARDRAARAV
jgi:uncharacterized protein (DUF58 family)